MKKIKSVLLPGEFFKNDFIVKTEKLMSLDIDTIYLFDHGKNPAGSDLDVYELIDGIYKLNEVVNGQIRLGVCVLNINARPFQELFEAFITDLWVFVTIVTIFYIPISILIGKWHTDTQLSVEWEMKMLEEPMTAKMIKGLLNVKEGVYNKEEIEEFRKFLTDIEKGDIKEF